jgi:lipopolysaccharide export system protein LptA
VRLEKTFEYNLIRALRTIIPLIVLGLIAVPVWNYFSRQGQEESLSLPSPLLVEDVSGVTEDIEFVRTEAGRPVFTGSADLNLGMDDGTQLYEGVSITIPGMDDSTPDRVIDCDDIDVDDETGDIGCTGEIEIQFDDETIIRTTEIEYDNATQTITTLRAAKIVRPGNFEVDADSLVLRLVDKILDVSGSVRITTEGGITLNVDRARYYQSESRIELIGGLRFSSSSGEIRARRGDLILTPETLDPEQLSFYGSVSAISAEGENPFTLGADSVRVGLSEGAVEHVIASGAAVVETMDSNGLKVLMGDQVDGYFGEDGQLQVVESLGRGRMVLGDGQELRSDRIRNDVADSTLRSGSNSILEVGEFRLEGSDFVIRHGAEVRFESQRPTVITLPEGSLSAPVTTATFDADQGELISLVQTGGAEFVQDGRRAWADRLESFAEGGVLLTGSAGLSDVGLNLNAEEIRLEQDASAFEASGSVRLVLSDDEFPILIEGEYAKGDESRVVFSSLSELWRDKLYIAASTSIQIEPDAGRFNASGDVVSTLGSFRVWADRLDVDNVAETVRYTGEVRGRSPELDLEASILELFLKDNEVDRVVAGGSLDLRSAGIHGRGDDAEYLRSEGTVTLTGNNAKVVAADTGSTSAPRVVWNVETNDIDAVGDEGSRVVSTRRLEQ